MSKVLKWSRNGWVDSGKAPHRPTREFNGRTIPSIRNKVCYYRQDSEELTGIPEIDSYILARREIQVGNYREAIDNLPTSIKYLLAYPDKWYINDRGHIIMAEDEEDQARSGNWGDDKEELFRNSPHFNGISLPIIEVLAGADLCDYNEDFLEDVHDPDQYFYTRLGSRERVHVPIESLGATDDNSFYDDEIIGDYSNIDMITGSDPDIVESYQHIPPAIPLLSEEATTKLEKILGVLEKGSGDLLDRWAEITLDKSLHDELVYSLNSPYCAFGYSQPRKRWPWRIYQYPSMNPLELAKEDRKQTFNIYVARILACKTIEDHNRLHELFLEQKKEDLSVIAKWSDEEKAKKRSEFRSEQFKKGKAKDEVNKACWIRFDSVRRVIPSRVKDGKIIKSKRYPNSIWNREKAVAFLELILTQEQWKGVFELLYKIKAKMVRREDNPKIVEIFDRCINKVETLEDLDILKEWLYKRNRSSKQIIKNDRIINREEGYHIALAPIDMLTKATRVRIENKVAITRRDLQNADQECVS